MTTGASQPPPARSAPVESGNPYNPDLISRWARAHGPALGSAVLKHEPEDFCVSEVMDQALSGDGEFLWVQVCKRGLNTRDAAKRLARASGLSDRAVSHSGLKDRQSVSTQWFSLHLPGQPDPDLSSALGDDLQLLDSQRHLRKLRAGTHRANRFKIRLRDLNGQPDALNQRLDQIARHGVPNYFGAQRFGRNGDNLRQALNLYAGGRRRRRNRHLDGLLHSAARAFLFNQVLQHRVLDQTWRCGSDNEIWMLAGTRSIFGPEPLTEDLRLRCRDGDITPTGPLYGSSDSTTWPAWEQPILAGFPELTRGLEANGARPARRRLVLRPQGLRWRLDESTLVLEFGLDRGEYATALIRELVEVNGQGSAP